ncbi:MAG: hypothetical protein Q4E87_04410, partial [bacterium]|nr:hypothetical protein [bacterium]
NFENRTFFEVGEEEKSTPKVSF